MAGAAGREYVNGERIPAKVRLDLQPDDLVVFDTPGGGCMGSPSERDPALIQADVESGLVTPEGAARDYGIEVSGAASND
jgi:N-methylhydantoinase B/oxoprolinase/acetone carboxylase alpha subunit